MRTGIKDLIREKNNNYVYCYGAGHYAFLATIYLSIYNIRIEKYIVTKKNKDNRYLTKDIVMWSEVCCELSENDFVLVAVSEKKQKQICIEGKASVFYFTTRDVEFVSKIISLWPVKKEVTEYFDLLEKNYIFMKKNKKEVDVLGKQWSIPDVPSFLSQYKEIMMDGVYEFVTGKCNPIIIDFGANIGMSIVFFLLKYPTAVIEGFEPDPNIFDILKNNVMGYDNGKLILNNMAVSDYDGEMTFYLEGSDGGRLEYRDNHSNGEYIKVRVCDAKNVLAKYDCIDMLKIDIEGEELKVLTTINEQLYKVRFIFIEYHSIDGEEQNIAEILAILKAGGFRVYFKNGSSSIQPFMIKYDNDGFDTQLEIYGVNNKHE